MHTPSRGPRALPAQARCRGHGDVCRRKKRHEGKRPVERRARRPRMPAPRPNEARSRIEGEPCAGIQRRKRTCDEKTGERAEKNRHEAPKRTAASHRPCRWRPAPLHGKAQYRAAARMPQKARRRRRPPESRIPLRRKPSERTSIPQRQAPRRKRASRTR